MRRGTLLREVVLPDERSKGSFCCAAWPGGDEEEDKDDEAAVGAGVDDELGAGVGATPPLMNAFTAFSRFQLCCSKICVATSSESIPDTPIKSSI